MANPHEPARKKSQYDCALPATASYGGYVRVGFEEIDTPLLRVKIREAVLIGYQTADNNVSAISKRMSSVTQLDKYKDGGKEGTSEKIAYNESPLQPVRHTTPVADVVNSGVSESSVDMKHSQLSDKNNIDTHMRTRRSHTTTTLPMVTGAGIYSEREVEDSNASADINASSELSTDTAAKYNSNITQYSPATPRSTTPTSVSSTTFNRMRMSSIAGISSLIKGSRISDGQRSVSCQTEALHMSSPLPVTDGLRRKTDGGTTASDNLSLDFFAGHDAHYSISESDTVAYLDFKVVAFVQGSGRGVNRDGCGKTLDVRSESLTLDGYISQEHDYLTEDLKADGPLTLAKRVARTQAQQQNTQTHKFQKNAAMRKVGTKRAQSTIGLVSSAKDVLDTESINRTVSPTGTHTPEMSMSAFKRLSTSVQETEQGIGEQKELQVVDGVVKQNIGAGDGVRDSIEAVFANKSDLETGDVVSENVEAVFANKSDLETEKRPTLAISPNASGRCSPDVTVHSDMMDILLNPKQTDTETSFSSALDEHINTVTSGEKRAAKLKTLTKQRSEGIGSISQTSTLIPEPQSNNGSFTGTQSAPSRRATSFMNKTKAVSPLSPHHTDRSPLANVSREPPLSDTFHLNLRRLISDNNLNNTLKDTAKPSLSSSSSNLTIGNTLPRGRSKNGRPQSLHLSPNVRSRGSSPSARRRPMSAMTSTEDLRPVVHNPVWDTDVTVNTGWTQLQKDQCANNSKKRGELQGSESVDGRSLSASTMSGASRWRRPASASTSLDGASRAAVGSIAESTASGLDKAASHGDYLDRLLGDVSKLVVVVMQGPVALGEIAIPMRNLTAQEGWFPLVPVSPLHREGLYKALKRTNPKGGRRVLLDTDMDDQTVFKNLHRKFISIRTALMSISGLELLVVVCVTTALVYNVTLSEMTSAVMILTKQIWLGLDVGLSREFLLPELQTVLTAGYFLIPSIQSSNSSTLITSYMYKSFNGTMDMNYTSPSGIFIAYLDNKVYMPYLDGNGDDFNHANSIRLLIQDTNVAPTAANYGINNTCVAEETVAGCTVYNLTDARPEAAFDIVDRPWFKIVANDTGPQWSPVYTFIGGSLLGATLAFRVPQDLSQPMVAIVGSDLTLFQMSRILDSQDYFKTGYAVMFESSQGNLLATTNRTQAAGGSLQRIMNCTTPGQTVLERVRLYDSGNELLDVMSDFLSQLCLDTGECYVDVRPELPATAGCDNKNPVVPDDVQCGYPATDACVVCESVPLGFQNASMALAKSDSQTPSVHIMNNGDILAIGFFSFVGGNLVLAVVVPADDYQDEFQHILHITVAAAVAILVLSLIAAAIVAHMVSRRLVECTKNLSKFARLDFSQAVESDGSISPVKEIARIYEVMGIIRTSMRSFSKYVPPDVVRLLVQSGLEATLGGQNKLITSFCTDIVNFTTISESLDIDELNTVLGDYLQCMSEIVHENKGTVDKYIGDSIVAMWNAPEIVVDHAHRACESALLCQARLSLLREEWALQGYPALHQRIGIHTGEAIVGNCGSVTRLNYTALGNNVDFASRLEADNKKYGTDVLISDVTYSLVKDDFVARPVDDVVMPGLQKRTCRLYELVAHNDTATSAQVLRCERFEKAYTTFHDRKDARAAVRFLHEYATHHLHQTDMDDIVDPNYDVLKALCEKELAAAKSKTRGRSRSFLQRAHRDSLVPL
ncbi:hypothetical protein SARC_07912 [Sphaeroforma arctica JP610]|uniref:Guanylate cyclase domain-containing protein n=1 Tax=Sphaeroforma arctica JP610 TaxID=667725 RepID=A0A0L0FT01_9EUKA|nr:hypothetical protein SARC_07912 [Sphaeroforma arctica JP610]KNC79701.1 hypothetical protein SARC_07912 [Sphaeroforma arctica JP610]|eukprot:XP_014153603.1 hypothetical protein SARC_07912 [Sphaeroforma arctica JP610]